MNKESLKTECTRLFRVNTITDCIDLLDIYSECLFQIVQNHHDEPVYTYHEADAKIVLQMILTKVLHLKNNIIGVSYISKDGARLNKIIDPTIVASLTRNIFETVGLFNLIYRYADNPDETYITYLLWVHSGLVYRQRFEGVITSEESRLKFEKEKEELESIKSAIEKTELYSKLDEKNKTKIQNRLREKEYLIRFEGTNVIFMHWHQLIETMRIKAGLLENIYTYFSQYSHPSNVSIFQFQHMFDRGEEAFLDITIFNLKIAFFMFSLFIADYIHFFPQVQKTFDALNIRDQIVIDFYNKSARGGDYQINDSWKACE
jgi:hypothetical protein